MDAAEPLLRDYGLRGLRLEDLALAVCVSKTAIYYYFANKSELAEAVVGRWLDRTTESLEEVAASPGPAAVRLRRWLVALCQTRRQEMMEGAGLFEIFEIQADEGRKAVEKHKKDLRRQAAEIIRAGSREGDFKVPDSDRAAAVVLDATIAFHHPHFVRIRNPDTRALDNLLDVLLTGLHNGAA